MSQAFSYLAPCGFGPGRYGAGLMQIETWCIGVKHMAVSIKSHQHHGSKREHAQLDMKNVLPTSFTWPDIDRATALMYEPNELQIRAKATKRVKRTTLDTHNAGFPLESHCSSMGPQRPSACAPILQMETTPLRHDMDTLIEPVELPLCSTPPEIHASFTQPPSDQPDFPSRLKGVIALRTVEPPVKRTKLPLRTSAKRKCLLDRNIGYTDAAWATRIESARTQHMLPGHWYHAWLMKWPVGLADRLGICTSKELLPLWRQTVEMHVHTLDCHYRTLTELAREAWAQRQVVSPVETTSQVEDPWPAEEYSSEVARGQEPKQNECEPLPWTSLGQTYMDWPEDMQEQSFSSANTSIVQAARWQSPRLPRMSSELLVKTTTNTSVGSLPCWSADADDSFATQARGLDGTELS